MASIFGSGSGAEPRSGGKIVRARPTVVQKTPYDRPKLTVADPQSPNWVSRYIVSPTRSIASGAGKLLSFVLDRESSPSSSYSSSCDINSSSEDEISAEDQENVGNGREDSGLSKKNRTVVAVTCMKEPLQSYGKTESTTEQLLMQETFSREEAERLVKIIRSRVVDSPANKTAANKLAGTSTHDLSSAAVMEARKWVQERKSRSELDSGDASNTRNSDKPPEVFGDGGSPADLAKTYMGNRPHWASSVDCVSSPSFDGIQLFKDYAPYSTSGKTISFSKRHSKRDYSATGSWNIQDEIRRVRSRATEEMLRDVPSSKLDYFAPTLEHKSSIGSSSSERLESKPGENVQDINLTDVLTFPGKEQMINDIASATDDVACPGKDQNLVAVQTSKDLPDNAEDTNSGQKFRSLNEVKILSHGDSDHGKADSVNTAHTQLLNPVANGIVEGAEGAVANGCPSSVSILCAGQLVERNEMECHEGQGLGSSCNITDKDIPQAQDETCHPMTETLMEIREDNGDSNVDVNEVEGAGSGFQNSSSVPHEELQQISEISDAAGTRITYRQRGKRLSKYNRRVKGRGK